MGRKGVVYMTAQLFKELGVADIRIVTTRIRAQHEGVTPVGQGLTHRDHRSFAPAVSRQVIAMLGETCRETVEASPQALQYRSPQRFPPLTHTPHIMIGPRILTALAKPSVGGLAARPKTALERRTQPHATVCPREDLVLRD
jgi:hypothetical protein